MTKDEIVQEHIRLAYESMCVLPQPHETHTEEEWEQTRQRKEEIGKRIKELREMLEVELEHD